MEAKIAADLLRDAIDPPEAEADHGVYVWAGDGDTDADHWWLGARTWERYDGCFTTISEGQIFSLAPADQKPAPLTDEQIAALPRVTKLPSP